jgi:hypothetical protein
MVIHLKHDIRPLIKLSFNTPKFTRGLDALSRVVAQHDTKETGISRRGHLNTRTHQRVISGAMVVSDGSSLEKQTRCSSACPVSSLGSSDSPTWMKWMQGGPVEVVVSEVVVMADDDGECCSSGHREGKMDDERGGQSCEAPCRRE